MSRAMTGAQMVLEALADQGVEHIFGYPGGAVLPIYDELFQQDRIKHILVRHEQGAVHAAEGYARSTGKVGVVLVTSGPGATNAVTGLTDALMDSIPVVCITGQVPTHLIGNDAFQECDTVGITRPCTKHNYLVKDVNALSRVLHEAFYVARTGRPGPVVVDIPKDIQFARGEYTGLTNSQHKSYNPQTEGDERAVAAAIDMMANAKRPIFYTGGGIINSGPVASERLRELVRMTGFPITSTLMGLGAYPASDKQWLGMLGMHGTYEANNAMHDCDVMICIGARFDDRITGRVDAFSPSSKKIHVDIDRSSINKNIKVDLPIVGDCARVLEQMIDAWKARKPKLDKPVLKSWWAEIDRWRARNCLHYRKRDDVIMPQYAIERLYALTRGHDTYITTEVGQHQMWAAQFFKFEEPNRWMTSGGLGTMGYGLPSAVGVQMAHPRRRPTSRRWRPRVRRPSRRGRRLRRACRCRPRRSGSTGPACRSRSPEPWPSRSRSDSVEADRGPGHGRRPRRARPGPPGGWPAATGRRCRSGRRRGPPSCRRSTPACRSTIRRGRNPGCRRRRRASSSRRSPAPG